MIFDESAKVHRLTRLQATASFTYIIWPIIGLQPKKLRWHHHAISIFPNFIGLLRQRTSMHGGYARKLQGFDEHILAFDVLRDIGQPV